LYDDKRGVFEIGMMLERWLMTEKQVVILSNKSDAKNEAQACRHQIIFLLVGFLLSLALCIVIYGILAFFAYPHP